MPTFVNRNIPNELDNIASYSSLFIESLMVLCNLVHYKLKLAKDKVEHLILMLKKSKLKSHLAQHNFLHAKWYATKNLWVCLWKTKVCLNLATISLVVNPPNMLPTTWVDKGFEKSIDHGDNSF